MYVCMYYTGGFIAGLHWFVHHLADSETEKAYIHTHINTYLHSYIHTYMPPYMYSKVVEVKSKATLPVKTKGNFLFINCAW